MKKQILAVLTVLIICLNPMLNAEDLSNLSKAELYKGIRSKTAKLNALKRKLVKTDTEAQKLQASLDELRDKEAELEKELKSTLMKNPDYKTLQEEQMNYRTQLKVLNESKQ